MIEQPYTVPPQLLYRDLPAVRNALPDSAIVKPRHLMIAAKIINLRTPSLAHASCPLHEQHTRPTIARTLISKRRRRC